jgi:hypothetical protein
MQLQVGLTCLPAYQVLLLHGVAFMYRSEENAAVAAAFEQQAQELHVYDPRKVPALPCPACPFQYASIICLNLPTCLPSLPSLPCRLPGLLLQAFISQGSGRRRVFSRSSQAGGDPASPGGVGLAGAAAMAVAETAAEAAKAAKAAKAAAEDAAKVKAKVKGGKGGKGGKASLSIDTREADGGAADSSEGVTRYDAPCLIEAAPGFELFVADSSRYMLEPQHEEDTEANRLRQLRQVPWVGDCGGHVAERLCQHTERVYYKPGQVLCEAGDRGTKPNEDACFLIVDGVADIVLHYGQPGEVVVDTSGAGECLGEMMLMTKNPRTATIRAKGHVDVLRILYEDMEAAMEAYPELKRQLWLTTARRIGATELAKDDAFKIWSAARLREYIRIWTLRSCVGKEGGEAGGKEGAGAGVIVDVKYPLILVHGSVTVRAAGGGGGGGGRGGGADAPGALPARQATGQRRRRRRRGQRPRGAIQLQGGDAAAGAAGQADGPRQRSRGAGRPRVAVRVWGGRRAQVCLRAVAAERATQRKGAVVTW